MAMSKYGYSQPLKCTSHTTSIKLHSLTRLLQVDILVFKNQALQILYHEARHSEPVYVVVFKG